MHLGRSGRSQGNGTMRFRNHRLDVRTEAGAGTEAEASGGHAERFRASLKSSEVVTLLCVQPSRGLAQVKLVAICLGQVQRDGYRWCRTGPYRAPHEGNRSCGHLEARPLARAARAWHDKIAERKRRTAARRYSLAADCAEGL